MTSKRLSHEEREHATKRPAPAGSPKLRVQRSASKDTVTIRFSALGKAEEDEEDEEEGGLFSTTSAAQDESKVATAVEACEEMFEEEAFPSDPGDALVPESSGSLGSAAQLLSSRVVERKAPTSSPTKSLSFPSSDNPFPTVVKSLSSDAEPRDGLPSAAAPTVRHRQLMKTLVKSLSSDTSQDSSSTSYRLPEPRLNLQLFKQFTQSRMPSAAASAAGDSKTAPCSPLTSPDRGGFFKVSEVEAKFEDTRRRLSEVISEPLQLLSKIMDEKSGSLVGSSLYRPKALSAGAAELSSGTPANGHVESNNNYCIKEEDGAEWETGSQSSQLSTDSPVSLAADTKSANRSSSRSVSLEKCSMSALAKQEDEEFCILYSDDFETSVETEASGSNQSDDGATKAPLGASTEAGGEDEGERVEAAPNVPLHTLTLVTLMVYGYFVLPLPTYVGGLLLGIGLGFLLAIGVVWLTGLKSPHCGFRHSRDPFKLWNLTKVDVKEPEMYKGWMNEISSYDPEMYHATMTHSVFVRLEGSVIRLSKPNHNVARRATHNEPKADVTYISQKIYDLSNSRVYLLPQNLARKRLWNKKYPICIDLGKQDDFMSKAEGDRPEAGDGCRGRGEERSSCSSSRELTLYLFGRTGREKEEWFQHFLAASRFKADLKKASCVSGAKSEAQRSHSRSSSRSSLEETLTSQPRSKDAASSFSSLSSSSSSSSSPPPATAGPGSARAKPLLDYSCYMATLLPQQAAGGSAAASPVSQSPQSSPGADKKFQSSSPAEVQPSGDEEQEDAAVAWVNAAVGRIFWDFLTEPHWAQLVSKKIQMKLSKIRLPYFMNELTLTELDMGSTTPRILRASKPSIDYRGLWFSLDMAYSGSFLMTLETKMNLIRLGKEEETSRSGECGKDGHRPRTYCLADSDEESSSAGSSDEDDFSEISNDSAGPDGWAGGHKPSKIMRFVDKITKSKYFQKATETEFIKKKMEEVSNTPLLLTVEVQQLRGTLAVNIPPPPTDRIWYGFRTPPHLELKARPKLGEREVTLAHVTDWIERKLDQEFQKVFVMPNMDDVWLSVMHSAMDQRSSGGPCVSAQP